MVLQNSEQLRPILRQHPDRANRLAAANFDVPEPRRIVFTQLCFTSFNWTASMANMAILRRAHADSNNRGSPVLIALEDSTVFLGLRKNTIESFEKAVSKGRDIIFHCHLPAESAGCLLARAKPY